MGEQLAAIQEKSLADLQSFRSQETSLTAKMKKGEVAFASLQSQMDAAEEQLKRITKEKNETTATMNAIITDLKNDLGGAKDVNQNLWGRVNKMSEDLKVQQV